MVSTQQLLFFVLWITPWTVSLTWSSSINNILSIRSLPSGNFGAKQELIDSIANGAQMAVDYCQEVFKWDRWNCPKSAFSRNVNQLPTKENAFARAITAAGIVYSITKNCSRGILPGCGCKRTNPRVDRTFFMNEGRNVDQRAILEMLKHKNIASTDWTWGGCSDDTAYAEKITKMFLDATDSSNRDALGYVNIHNENIGKIIVREMMQKRCRCHGVSGSCNLQTCWMQMVPFEELADMLRKLYEKATRITYENQKDDDSIFVAGNSASRNIESLIKSANPREMVFLEESPNYCLPNKIYGWKGTKGRTCSRSKSNTTKLSEKRSCKNLCKICGHRVKRQSREVTRRCNCRFKWCCEVSCEYCTETVNEFYCY